MNRDLKVVFLLLNWTPLLIMDVLMIDGFRDWKWVGGAMIPVALATAYVVIDDQV